VHVLPYSTTTGESKEYVLKKEKPTVYLADPSMSSVDLSPLKSYPQADYAGFKAVQEKFLGLCLELQVSDDASTFSVDMSDDMRDYILNLAWFWINNPIC
jgi:hypothetical protein